MSKSRPTTTVTYAKVVYRAPPTELRRACLLHVMYALDLLCTPVTPL